MHVETIIVGAGPAGLQLAAFLQRGGQPYLVLERAAKPGASFQVLPSSGQLLSLHKHRSTLPAGTSPEAAFRADWNSLLAPDGPTFSDFSKDTYPDRDDYRLYLAAFAKHHGLKVQYESPVKQVRKLEELAKYEVIVQVPAPSPEDEMPAPARYTCDKLVMATGLSVPRRIAIEDESKRPVRHVAEYPKDWFRSEAAAKFYRGKSVLLVGNGNSAFELAELLNQVAASVSMFGRRPPQWSVATHYDADVRPKSMAILDSILVECRNAYADAAPYKLLITQEGGAAGGSPPADAAAAAVTPYTLKVLCSAECKTRHTFGIGGRAAGYDEIILCTGFQLDTDIFDFEIPVTGPESLPVLNPTYESAAHKNLFFIGSLMHSLDYRQSAGCSVRGFRHLIAFFYQIHYAKAFSTHSFAEPGGAKKALQHILERMNTSAALFHMHGQLADIFYYDSARKSIEYMESVSPWLLHQNQFPVSSSTYVCVLTLEYGKKPADRLSKLGRKLSRIGSENRATRLHPVVRIYKDVSQSGKQLLEEIHLDENLYADFTDKEVYTNRLVRILRMILH